MSQSLLHLNDKLVSRALLKYVANFGDLHQLWPKTYEQKSFMALSGGADSMLLTYCVSSILRERGLAPPIALHVNYETRDESDKEQKLCELFCDQLQIEIHSFRAEGISLETSDFERKARDIRYNFFKKFLKNENDLLYMGHHLDDCYEWSMLMDLKSSRLRSRLGTPVKNKNIRRPFHCLSKQQILNLCEKLSIPYAEDSSNQSDKFERNKIRAISEFLKKSYPNLLKNYISQQKELLALYENNKKAAPIISYCTYGGVVLRFNDIKQISSSELSSLVTDYIYKFSSKSRGKLRDQLAALMEGQKKSKMGPYAFSGDVLVYPIPNGFYVLSRKIQEKWDQYFLNTQIPMLKHPVIELVLFDSTKHQKISRNIHPLFAVIKNEIVGRNYGWVYNL